VKYQVLINGELEDEIFDTYEEAQEHAVYLARLRKTRGGNTKFI